MNRKFWKKMHFVQYTELHIYKNRAFFAGNRGKGPSIKNITTFSCFLDPSLPYVLNPPQFSDLVKIIKLLLFHPFYKSCDVTDSLQKAVQRNVNKDGKTIKGEYESRQSQYLLNLKAAGSHDSTEFKGKKLLFLEMSYCSLKIIRCTISTFISPVHVG